MYTALDKRTNAKVAIKIIKTEYLLSSLDNQKRVEGEMHAMNYLNHKYIVKMHEQSTKGVMLSPSGTIEGNISYIVMEHI